MSLRFHSLFAFALFCLVGVSASAVPLRICADPNNLPFSNRAGAGFDNRIAMMIAHDLHREPVFVWARARRGFLREQFNKNVCDLLPGVPEGMHGVAVSTPYYTSSYVFVSPARERLEITSFSDPKLNGRRIGLQILDEDLAPPSLPLIRAGHAGQLVGYDSFDGKEGDVVRALEGGDIGVAVVWGPVAGYYAHRSNAALSLTPVPASYRFSGVPFTYAIGFATHPQDAALLQQINASIVRLQPQIDRILADFHVPIVNRSGEGG